MNCLETDLYEITMAAGFWQAGKTADRAVFELFIRRLPPGRDFLIAAGLQQAIEYLTDLRVSGDQVDYLRRLPVFSRTPAGFFEYLREFRFTGDVFAVREGTPVFANEPILTVQAPLIEAQIPETYLLSTISFQTMIATKAHLVVKAAAGKGVVEFGTRRAHSPGAGVLAGRAAYIGGCIGTSNVETGFRYGVPVFGTAAHSWVLAFASERESFAQLQTLLGPDTVYLIDTYDTLEGAKLATDLGRPLWGVRLDSGDLIGLSKNVRKILDDAGLKDAKIMATSDLDEERLRAICEAGAPIDSFGVGTQLATSGDAPNLAAVYKLVQIESQGVKRYVAKHSSEKQTVPGAKQIFRYEDRDVIAAAWECLCSPQEKEHPTALLRPVMLGGGVVEALPSAAESREYCRQAIAQIAPDHEVEYSKALLDLTHEETEHR